MWEGRAELGKGNTFIQKLGFSVKCITIHTDPCFFCLFFVNMTFKQVFKIHVRAQNGSLVTMGR